MSSNSNLEIVNLDFATLKNNLKTFLANQDKFNDYDFDGSNMSVLLDLLAYNTYMNSFYLNMVASEMFLDSAQLRDSVISHAKELNYLPRSFQSSAAKVDIKVTPAVSTQTVTLLKGTSFTSRVGSNTFTFVVNQNYSNTTSNSSFSFNNIDIYEGELISETFVYTANSTLPQIVVSNPNVDNRSLEVYVYEDNGNTILTYTRGTTFLGLNANSQVFFVQPARNDRYEIVFGNGTQGRRPKDGSVVVIGYRACNGELPNGASVFATNSTVDGHSNVQITTVASATGGLIHETIQSIKKNAPRAFQTQERAVTASDYKIILQNQYPEIESINVYGGEDADPPQFGRVFICVDLENSDGVPSYKKDIYKEFIKSVTPLSIDPIFIDPDFIYLDMQSNIKYNLNTITTTENSLLTLVNNKIQVFNQENLNNFGVTFRFSKLISEIDATDKSIVSNETTVIPFKEITPSVTSNNTFTITFNNALLNQFTEESTTVHRAQDLHAVFSSTFIYRNQTCRFEDDNNGNIVIVAITSDNHTIIETIGTVDYLSGKISIQNFKPTSYSGAMRVQVVTDSNDIVASRNDKIRIRPTDISLTATSVRE